MEILVKLVKQTGIGQSTSLSKKDKFSFCKRGGPHLLWLWKLRNASLEIQFVGFIEGKANPKDVFPFPEKYRKFSGY